MGQGKDRDIDIYVRPLAGNPGQYEFSMDRDFGADEEMTFDKAADGMWRSESYKLTFHLKNREGANLKFSNRLDKVLWAERTQVTDPPCPTSQQMDNVFWIKNQNDIEDLKVVVTNKDKDRERFIFAFNFLPATVVEGPSTPATDYVLYDPIGNNEDGGWPRSYAMIAPLTAAGAGVGALIGALAAPLLNPEPTTLTYILGAAVGAILGYGIGLVLAKPSADAARSAPHA